QDKPFDRLKTSLSTGSRQAFRQAQDKPFDRLKTGHSLLESATEWGWVEGAVGKPICTGSVHVVNLVEYFADCYSVSNVILDG
ncbi:MAG: hypothetical protein H8D74_00025, partial [Chloroflexi bacterium]|nr:hypothetical protein [Chloroflexota bacterium]